MKLVIVSGFMGTGKTTLIVKVAHQAVRQNLKVAILVNEIGDIGIDDQFMRRLGMEVWEILGGCICCTLSGNLGAALDRLSVEYHPDIVLMEPSGAANLESVDRFLDTYDKQAAIRVNKLTIVDPLRLEMMMTVLKPLITSQIESAEVVIINKQDLASAEEMAQAMRVVQELNPGAKLYSLSIIAETEERVMDILPQ